MATIEAEIDANDGIYPFNKGRLSMAEVCRRAGVHKITLQGEAHRSTSRVLLKNWLDSLDKLLKGNKVVRRRVNSVIDDWKTLYQNLARSYNEMYAIEIVVRDEKITAALARVSALENEVLQLRAQLSNRALLIIPKKDKI